MSLDFDITPRTQGQMKYQGNAIWLQRIWTHNSMQSALKRLEEAGYRVVKNDNHYYASVDPEPHEEHGHEIFRAIYCPMMTETKCQIPLFEEPRWRVMFHIGLAGGFDGL